MERRLKALTQKAGMNQLLAFRMFQVLIVFDAEPKLESTVDTEYSSSEDEDAKPETDQDRRRALLESIDKSDLDGMRTSWSELEKEFIFATTQNDAPSEPVAGPSRPRPPNNSIIVIDDSDEDFDDGNESNDDTQLLTSSKSTATTPSSHSKPPQKKQRISYGSIVKDEIQQRTKESLGMSGPGRTLGGSSDSSGPSSSSRRKEPLRQQTLSGSHDFRAETVQDDALEWSCLVCTL